MIVPRKAPYLSILALFLVLAFMPNMLKPYQLNMFTEIILFALYAISYNLLLGYAGLLSFGHAMFFGTGAFTVAVAVNHIPGLTILSAVLLAVLVTTITGLLIGSLLLRHKGAYFALLTLAFNALFYAVATKWHSVTGGDDGLSFIRPDLNTGLWEFNMASLASFYYFTLIILGPVILFCWYFTRTAMGQTVVLLRTNEERMKFLGYNTNLSRLILFTFTGALAGLAGAFYALQFQFVSISAISIDMTTAVLLMTFVGGTRTFWGPILGALVYIILQNYLSDLTDRWPFFMGLIFVLMVMFIPGGLSQMILTARDRFLGWITDRSSTVAAKEVH
jgi:branched-chain amino acid transport system permease protein